MLAAVWHKKQDVRIEEVTEPEAGPGQVKIKIKVCGICGTDLHEYRHGPFLIPSRPHPLTGMDKGPVILGHEFSGEVVDCGIGVSGFSKGDRVTVNPLITCGECTFCRAGEHNMCLKLGTMGLAADGAFAEYIVVSQETLFRLPQAMSDDMGAFVEPLAVAVRAVKRSRFSIGHSAAVIGAGPIGVLVLQVIKNAGASKVFVVEPIPERRKLAQSLGATAVLDPNQGDPGREIAKLTDDMRVDRAFDCVGNQASFDTAIKVSGRHSVICQVGLALKPIEVSFIRLWGHEKEITTSSGYADEFPAAMALLEDGRVKIDPMVTSRIGLKELIKDGFQPLVDTPQKHIKILVYPGK